MNNRDKNADKVLLVTPPYHCGVVESAGRWPNLGFVYIAGELEKVGFEVEIYDAMSKFHDYDQIRAHIRDLAPGFIGVTAITATINDAVKVLKIAREECPNVTTFLGGVHPTFCWEEILSLHSDVVDYCVLGEGELTTPELLEAHRKGSDIAKVPGIAFVRDGQIWRTSPREFAADLDVFTPAWHLVNWSDYPLYFIDNSTVAILSSSRGCIHECAFCSQHKFWQGSYRQRDPHKVVAEIEHLAKTYGINVFFIADEYPTYDRQRWETILDLLIEKKLGVHLLMETTAKDILRDHDIIHRYREAGILFIYIGVESTSDKKLVEFKKDVRFEDSKKALQLIRDAGMIVESSLILGTPDETPETIKETLALAREYNADFMHFLLLAPWPYADMYDSLKPYIEVFDYSKYNLVEPVIKPRTMTRDQLMKQVLNCYRSYYMKKLPEWATMKGNPLKRSCLIRGMNAIMKNSFLKDHMKGLGGMPEHVVKLIKSLDF
ncbi:MAG: radical SAM protein [Candidatus Aminicenantes bacterium]|nr:radical SAM protein [Candidatus Aminicenantes bacterium]NIM79358.1 radical SAM protein [Candidatus Aminicenantes bacterium]NIN18635.1 radical SAM protein [Candidatus Aminicenantes bacterium]NIN42524.1 radical SAM protein [Candidatus Aminicenantes bacterium]NIN85290.1 radical SAM protein [Candidatus Aminicenantes bacterium]